MRCSSLLLLLLAANIPTGLVGADATTAQPVSQGAGQAGDPAAQRAEADRFAAEGKRLVDLYRRDQQANAQAIIDAMLAYTKAHAIYEALGDTDLVCDTQANMFWCKKQMNLDTLKTYLAGKGQSGTPVAQQEAKQVEQTLAKATAVVEKKVDASEAETYLARAERFAKDNANDHFGVSVRFFEVAQRFVGTPVGIKAQQLSLAAQDRAMKAFQDSVKKARETRFTKPARVSGKALPLPEAGNLKSAIDSIKKTYAADYKAASQPADKRNLARKLAREAEKSKDDAVVYCALWNEVVRLGVETEEYELLLDGTERLAATFTGFDLSAERKRWLAQMRSRALSAPILSLLDKPDDPAANLAVGRFYCYDLNRWAQGLPMLALGSDADLKKVAELELADPKDAAEWIATADAWYAVGKATNRTEERNAIWSHARRWYVKAAPSLQGATKARIDLRLTELEKALPIDLASLDWDRITAIQWDKLRGLGVVVQARVDRTDTQLVLGAKERVRVVPHPSDTWTFKTSYTGTIVCDHRGKLPPTAETIANDKGKGKAGSRTPIAETWFSTGEESRFWVGQLLCWLDNGSKRAVGEVSGPGHLYLSANQSYYTDEAKGQIRVKIVTLPED